MWTPPLPSTAPVGLGPKSGAPADAEQPATSSAVPRAAASAARARRDMIPSLPVGPVPPPT